MIVLFCLLLYVLHIVAQSLVCFCLGFWHKLLCIYLLVNCITWSLFWILFNFICLLHIKCNVEFCCILLHIFILCIAHNCTLLFTHGLKSHFCMAITRTALTLCAMPASSPLFIFASSLACSSLFLDFMMAALSLFNFLNWYELQLLVQYINCFESPVVGSYQW